MYGTMLDSAARTRDTWLHRPWATLLPLLVILPFSLSGAVRYTLGLGLGASLALVLVLCALAGAAVHRYGLPDTSRARSWHAALAALLVTLGLTAVTFRLWWTPLYRGLPNTAAGIDIGSHLAIFHNFSSVDPKQYEGFVGLYALMYWYGKLFATTGSASATVFYGLRFAHYAYLLALPVALSLVLYPVLATISNTRRLWTVALLSLPAQLAVLVVALFLPLEYYAAEGFYSQIAGLYPLVFGWLFYGLVEHAGSRFVLCCAWLVVQRFTYGLNLGDTLVTLSYLWLWEASEIRTRWLRYGALAFVPVALFTGYTVYVKLLPMRSWLGLLTAAALPWSTGVQLLLSVALLMAPDVFESAGVVASRASVRLWRFAGAFGFINGALTAVYFALGEPREYYILKYGLYAMVLVSMAALGPLCTLIAHFVQGDLRWRDSLASVRLSIGVLVITGLVSLGFVEAYRPYRGWAQERYQRTVPNAMLFSIFEPRVDSFIQRTLAAHHATFGGYFDPHWSRMLVHNTVFGGFFERPTHHLRYEFFASTLTFPSTPGRCIFAAGEPGWYHTPPDSATGAQIRDIAEHSDDCKSYVPRWGAAPLKVCAKCVGPVTSQARPHRN